MNTTSQIAGKPTAEKYIVHHVDNTDMTSSLGVKILRGFGLALYHSGLIALKITLVTPVLALITLSVGAIGLSYLAPSTKFKRCTKALFNELVSIAAIIMRFGYYKNSEKLQPITDEKGSARFMYVASDNIVVGATPILYAPGYLDTPETFVASARRLSQETHSPVYLLKYRSLFQSIDEHALDVVSLAEKIQQETHQNEIILMGHSMGGLSTGKAIGALQSKGRPVKKWITLASPLTGTNMAYMGLGTCAKNMRCGSKFLNEFEKPTVQALHLQSDLDWVVPTNHDYDNSHIPKTPSGHLSIRDSAESEKYVANFINDIV